ncbi:MAG: NUDIX domain-containing protein [Faecousia sp.]
MDERERIVTELLGKMVHVEVDRPVGYRHGDMVYPVNYGCIPGVMAGDGEEQDAYILGVPEPISSFDGRVIGVIRRRDDCEDKLVVAPDGMVFHQGEIAEMVHFQEQYFDITIDSLLQKSCGIIPYRRNGDGREFLVLLQTNHCWSFPKGHMEAGETETETALRELLEETGLRARVISGARVVSEYAVSPVTRKQVVLFLGEVSGDVILQKSEIVDYRWVRPDKLKDYLHPDTYNACAKLV